MRTLLVTGLFLGASLVTSACKESGTDCDATFYDGDPDAGGALVETIEYPYDDIDGADDATAQCQMDADAELDSRDDVTHYVCACSTR